MSRIVNNSLVHYRILYNRTTGVYRMQYHTLKKDTTNEITGYTLPDFVKNASKVLGIKSPVKCFKFQSLFQKQKTICLGYELAYINK